MNGVAYCFDKNGLFPALVSLGSLLRNARIEELGHIYLVNDGLLAPEDREFVTRFIQRWNCPDLIKVIEYDFSQIDVKTLSHPYITKATLLRLLVPGMAVEVDGTILYVDVDTIFRDNVCRLFDIDISRHTIGAVEDYAIPIIGWGNRLDYCMEAYALDADQAYFNSGLLLVNKDRFMGEDICSQVVGFLEKYFHEMQNRAHLYDQDALNAVCSRSWKKLPLRWNTPWETAWKTYEKDSESCRVRHSSMIHFMGSQKPWKVGLKSTRAWYYHRKILSSRAFTPGQYLSWEFNYVKSNLKRLLRR